MSLLIKNIRSIKESSSKFKYRAYPNPKAIGSLNLDYQISNENPGLEKYRGYYFYQQSRHRLEGSNLFKIVRVKAMPKNSEDQSKNSPEYDYRSGTHNPESFNQIHCYRYLVWI